MCDTMCNSCIRPLDRRGVQRVPGDSRVYDEETAIISLRLQWRLAQLLCSVWGVPGNSAGLEARRGSPEVEPIACGAPVDAGDSGSAALYTFHGEWIAVLGGEGCGRAYGGESATGDAGTGDRGHVSQLEILDAGEPRGPPAELDWPTAEDRRPVYVRSLRLRGICYRSGRGSVYEEDVHVGQIPVATEAPVGTGDVHDGGWQAGILDVGYIGRTK